MALRASPSFACVLALPLAARAQMCSGMMTGTIGLAEPQSDGIVPLDSVVAGRHRRLRPRRVRLRLGRRQPRPQPRDQADHAIPDQHLRHRRDLGRRLELHQRPPPAPRRATRPARRSRRRRSRTSPSTATRPRRAACTTSIKADALSNPNPQDPTMHICDPDQGRAADAVEQRLPVRLHRPQQAARHLHADALGAPAGPRPGHRRQRLGRRRRRHAQLDRALARRQRAVVLPDPLLRRLRQPDPGHAQHADLLGLRQRHAVAPRSHLGRLGSSTGDDGGVVDVDRHGAHVASRPTSAIAAPARPKVAACPADMGVSAFADGGALGPGMTNAFAALDPRYVCSDQITPHRRLAPHRRAHQRPDLPLRDPRRSTPSATPRRRATSSASPQPTEDLWRRYRDDGGGARRLLHRHRRLRLLREPLGLRAARLPRSGAARARRRPLVRRLVLRALAARRRLDRRARLGARLDARRARAGHRRRLVLALRAAAWQKALVS